MAISIRASGSWAAVNATTQTVTLPTHAAGDMLIVRAACKPFSADPTIATTGWTRAATFTEGSTANGNGIGSMRVAVFYKEATSSSETNPQIAWGTTAAPGAAVALSYQKDSGENWEIPEAAGGGDTSAGTGFSATIGSHIPVTAGDMVDFFYALRDESTLTVPSISQTGVTYGTVSEQPAAALSSTTSNDISADGGYRLATAGVSSAAGVITGTASTSETGAGIQTRLRVYPNGISGKAFGSWAYSNATTQTVTIPSGGAEGDLMLMYFAVKPFSASPSIDEDWIIVGTRADGSTANGDGTGSVLTGIAYKIAGSSESNPTITWGTTSAPGGAVITIFRTTDTGTWSVVGAGGGGTSAGTGFSATIDSDPGIIAGDMGVAVIGIRDDSTITSPTFTTTGVTWDSVVEYPATAGSTTTSNDMSNDACYRIASSGTSSAATEITATLSTSETGSAYFARVRVSSGGGNTYSQEVLADNPIVYYRLSEPSGATAIDSSGNGRDGTFSGDITHDQTGPITGEPSDKATGWGLGSGGQGLLSKADEAALDLGDGPFTIEFWAKRQATGTSGYVFNKGVGAYGGFFSSSDDKFHIERVNTQATAQTTATFDTNWHHIVWVQGSGGTDAILYVDGVAGTDINNTSTFTDTNDPLELGRAPDATNFLGLLDEFAIYGTALSAGRVLAHYNAAPNTGGGGEPTVTYAHAQALAHIKQTYSSFAQAQADIKKTTSVWAQVQSRVKQTYQGFAQSQARIKNTYSGFAQANTSIKATSFGFAQAQAKIIPTRVFAQSQAQIKQIYQGYAQAQADIEATINRSAQAQARIKQTYSVFAQARVWIEQTYVVSAQAQARIKQTYFGFAQSRASVKATYHGFAQAQTNIESTINQSAQAQAEIKQVYNQFAQAQSNIKQTYAVSAQAQTLIKQIYNVFAQARTSVATTSWAFAQAQVKIATTRVYAQSQTDIKQTYRGFAQAQSDIKQTYRGFAQSQADIKQIGYGWAQAQAILAQTYSRHAQAQSQVKQTYFGFAQAQTKIIPDRVFGQAQAQIKQIYSVHAQAQTNIESVVSRFAQAQADIKATANRHAQAQADIKQQYNAWAQSQAWIEQTYRGFAQARVWVENTYSAFAQAQAGIKSVDYAFAQAQVNVKTTYSVHAQSQAEIKQVYNAHAQSQADIKQVYQGHGQARVWIESTYNGFGQARASIKQTYSSFAQAQVKINAFNVNQWAQAQCWVAGAAIKVAQAQATIKAAMSNWAQAQADIKQTYNNFAQANADILVTYSKHAQAQTVITQTYQGYAQAQTNIKTVYEAFAQSQASVLQTYQGYAQAQADIKSVYNGWAQAQALVGTQGRGFAQAQATLKATGNAWAQSNADIKATNNQWSQAQAYVSTNVTRNAQAQAWIKITDIEAFSQAQAQIKQIYIGFAQSQVDIKQTYAQFAQAQSIIKQTYFASAQAQVSVKTSNFAFAQSQAYILNGRNAHAQAQAQILQTYQAFAQANVFISKLAGYAQAQAFIRQDRIIQDIEVSDNPSIIIELSDFDANEMDISDSDSQSLYVVEVSDQKLLIVEVSDSAF